ncbi:MAG: sulfatase [Planctomycetaceae bacterium]|nr:sulfatase [Planctomycetaceae bacterium]
MHDKSRARSGWQRHVACFLIPFAAQFFVPTSALADRPPNVIVIFTDDQGYNDLGCYGSAHIRTPRLDQMAAEGLRLTSFYAQPVCGVSRAALMTGCYPIRVAEPDNVKRLHTVLHPREWTMAEMFQQAGYATAMIGKWHLGLRDGQGVAGYRADTMPNAQGFDEYFGTPAFNGARVFVNDSPFRSPLVRNQEVVRAAVHSWDDITAEYTAEALRWIEAHREESFFLYLAHNMPHIPLGASDQFRGKSEYGPYGDAIEEIDWSCGQIFQRLKELQLDDQTLVIFTSDNGPWIETTQAMKPNGRPFIPRDHSGTADPLRGWKMSAWEGGSRVPCLIRWPGKIPAGSVSDEILATLDLLPTFAQLAGCELPPDLQLDGSNATDFLLGRTATSPREEYLYYAGCLLTGVRVGRWKLVLPRRANPPGTGWWGRMLEAVPSMQLFDLDSDPGERTNVAGQHPDVVERLLQHIDSAREELGDIDRIGKGARSVDDAERRLEASGSAGQSPNVPNATATTVPAAPLEPVGNLRFTFEDRDWQGWRTIEGDLQHALTDRRNLPNHKSHPFNKQGDWFLFTGNQRDRDVGNDRLTGVLASPTFILRGGRMRFLVGGGQGKLTYVALVDSEGRELRTASGTNGPQLKQVDWDVQEWIGKQVAMRIVDRSQGGWGHVTFDDFSCDGELVEPPAANSRTSD